LLLVEARDGLVTRYLLEHREAADALFVGGLDALLIDMHGDAEGAYEAAVHSHLESARFPDALGLILAARRARLETPVLAALEPYATGLRAYRTGDYGASIDALGVWLDVVDDAMRADEERVIRYARFALPPVERIADLADGPDRAALIGRAKTLAERLRARIPGEVLPDPR
jgi:hypothetical protein